MRHRELGRQAGEWCSRGCLISLETRQKAPVNPPIRTETARPTPVRMECHKRVGRAQRYRSVGQRQGDEKTKSGHARSDRRRHHRRRSGSRRGRHSPSPDRTHLRHIPVGEPDVAAVRSVQRSPLTSRASYCFQKQKLLLPKTKGPDVESRPSVRRCTGCNRVQLIQMDIQSYRGSSLVWRV